MADTETNPAQEQEVVGEKEANKNPSPKPDTDVAPPLISVDKGELLIFSTFSGTGRRKQRMTIIIIHLIEV